MKAINAKCLALLALACLLPSVWAETWSIKT